MLKMLALCRTSELALTDKRSTFTFTLSFQGTLRSSLSIHALRACVYIYIQQLSSSSWAPTLWFNIDLTGLTTTTPDQPTPTLPHTQMLYSIHFSEFITMCFTRKQTKQENTPSLPFLYYTKLAADSYKAGTALILREQVQ